MEAVIVHTNLQQCKQVVRIMHSELSYLVCEANNPELQNLKDLKLWHRQLALVSQPHNSQCRGVSSLMAVVTHVYRTAPNHKSPFGGSITLVADPGSSIVT